MEFPDLRLEYDDPVLGRTRVDLELVSDAYHKGHVAAKHCAGFTLYSASGDAARGIRSLGGSNGRGGSGRAGPDLISSLRARRRSERGESGIPCQIVARNPTCEPLAPCNATEPSEVSR